MKRCPRCDFWTYRKNVIGEWYCIKCGFSSTRRGTDNVDRD